MGHDNEVEVERFRRSLGVSNMGVVIVQAFRGRQAKPTAFLETLNNLEFRPMKLSTP